MTPDEAAEMMAWLREQLDAEERAARVIAGPGDRWQADYVDPYGYMDQSVREHILRHNPTRVLAEVAAKRAILDLHSPTSDRMGLDETTWTYGDIDPACSTCGASDYARPWPCETIKALTRSFAGQPGWREGWQA